MQFVQVSSKVQLYMTREQGESWSRRFPVALPASHSLPLTYGPRFFHSRVALSSLTYAVFACRSRVAALTAFALVLVTANLAQPQNYIINSRQDKQDGEIKKAR